MTGQSSVRSLAISYLRDYRPIAGVLISLSCFSSTASSSGKNFRDGALAFDRFVNAVNRPLVNTPISVHTVYGLYKDRRVRWKVEFRKNVSRGFKGYFRLTSIQSGSFADENDDR